MKKSFIFTGLFLLLNLGISANIKTIHVFVALCDNENQGIVPVPQKIGNGKDPYRNLYWGAGYGVKNYFDRKTDDWIMIKKWKPKYSFILERILFKHKNDSVYLLADAYDGAEIKSCIEDFLMASNGQKEISINHDSLVLSFGGGSQLVSYVGHDGLMEFDAEVKYLDQPKDSIDVIILACYSKEYFMPEIKMSGAKPVLWTTHLMAPEAYTLKAAIDGWILNESGKQIDERAAQEYNKYHSCGIRGARNLFTTGF